ncbi:uncharacterized protein LOC141686438 [Apium graveolens]|uniref:uncharacterized protein LOC141686438 n=1 Tax=Apium graveolens TaxID=4045 RepID=UPI003D78F8CC
MCAEGFNAMIRRNEATGILHGVRVAAGAPTISYLLFDDDCYLFFRATETEAEVLKRILKRYEAISGQVVNFNKSTISFSPNTAEQVRREICDKLEVKEVKTPGKYLGIPMHIGRNKVTEFAFLLERVEQKLQGWSNQTLSKAGKITLLKTSAQTVPNFWMNLMLIPKEICDKIEKRMNAFWWHSDSTGGGIKWMSWDRLCSAKEEGGLGFKKLKEFNVAMLAKQAWRLVNNVNPMVTKFMQARYFPDTDFLNASLGNNPSYLWRSILAAHDIIKQ